MTAIYGMWNQGGFSLASDSNATQMDGDGNSVWIDPIEKMVALKDHQIAFAAAGSSRIDGIDINELIRQWEKTIKQPLPFLEDYLISFLNWFSNLDHPGIFFGSVESLKETIKTHLKSWKELLEEAEIIPQSASFEAILETALEKTSYHSVDKLNCFGSHFKNFEKQHLQPTYTSASSEIYSYNITSKIVSNIAALQEGAGKNGIRQQKFMSLINPLLNEIFNEIFDCDWDPSSSWQLAMVEIEYLWLENIFHNNSREANCLFIGYGENEWFPRAIKFTIADSRYGFKKARLDLVANPDHQWYVHLGVARASDALIEGYSRDFRSQLPNLLGEKLNDEDIHLIMSGVDEFGSDRTQITLKKTNNLSSERLEYVARLFVELEALQSYLAENLPGVGGNVNVVTMTKTTRRTLTYPEFQ